MSTTNWPPACNFNEIEDAIYRYLLIGKKVTPESAAHSLKFIASEGASGIERTIRKEAGNDLLEGGVLLAIREAALSTVDWEYLTEMVKIALEARVDAR